MYYAYARKIPATDTQGSRIRVKVQGRTSTFPYNYTVSDPHQFAIQQVIGPNATVTYDTHTANGWRYKVEDAN